MSNTDEHVEEFENLGYTHEQAVELATNYIFYGCFDVDKSDFTFLYDFNIVGDYEINDLHEYDNSGYEIGCDFKGVYGFEEFENDLYYIPSSYHCVIKCFEKILELNRHLIPFKLPEKIVIDLESFKNGSHDVVNPYGISIPKSKQILLNYLHKYSINKQELHKYIPEFFRYSKKDQRAILISKKKKVCIFNSCILLLFFENKKHHAIIWKDCVPKKKDIQKLKFKIVLNKYLSSSQKKISIPIYNDKLTNDYKIIAYDIETYIETTIQNNMITKMLIPYSLGYCYLDNYQDVKILTIKNKHDSLFDIFIDNLIQETSSFNNIYKLYIYAHNGSKFDNLYARCCKQLHIETAIKKGNVFKNITSSFINKNGNKVYLHFRDTLPFVLTNLKKACEAFNCSYNKLDFDIIDWTFEDFINKDNLVNEHGFTWKDYLITDVKCLAQLIIKIDESLIYPGFKIINHLGIPSVSWNLILKTCFNIKDVFISTDPITLEFERASVYGGRVLRWKSLKPADTNKLISLDVNSLYPASMNIFKFPVGKRYILSDTQLQLLNTRGLAFFKDIHATNFIVEIEFKTSNIKYPVVPWKDNKGNIFYKLGTLTGVYNDVDIELMINDGYIITKFIRGFYFKQNKFIFKQLIQYLYDERIQMQQQKNHREFIYKNIINSMYGVMLLSIKDGVKYVYNIDNELNQNKYNISGFKQLKNKQYEVYYKLDHDQVNHPIYIGGYILSYARMIMNFYIDSIGRHNIWYSDTDSIYVDLNILNQTNITLSNTLGGIKNDYGNNKYIIEALFVDLKRYLLIFNDNTFKQKCLGVNFKSATFINDFYKDVLVNHDINSIKYFYSQLLLHGKINIEVDKWFRNCQVKSKFIDDCNQINIINNNINIDITNRDKRGIINNNMFTPIGFINSIEYIPNYCLNVQSIQQKIESLKLLHEYNFSLVGKKLYVNTPLVYKYRIKLLNPNIYTSFYIGVDTNNYYYSHDLINYYILSHKLGVDLSIKINLNEKILPLLCIQYNDPLAYNHIIDDKTIQLILKVIN